MGKLFQEERPEDSWWIMSTDAMIQRLKEPDILQSGTLLAWIAVALFYLFLK